MQNKNLQKEEFTQALKTCHKVIRDNDKLSPEAAFDEISKILFMKILRERQSADGERFSLKTYQKERDAFQNGGEMNTPYFQVLFRKTKEAYLKDELFELYDVIQIRENSFEHIIQTLEPFNLSKKRDDVKGMAFEHFLGKTFRGDLGQYFTPREVVDFMVHIVAPQFGELICDPCCGSGGFLINVFETIRSSIEKEGINVNERIATLSQSCIFGSDANPRMARTAKMNMIMHGDGHGGVYHHDGLLNVGGIWENRFDVILTNPPFGAHVGKTQRVTEADRYKDERQINNYLNRYGVEFRDAMLQVDGNVGKPLLSLFEVGKMTSMTEALFVERCLNLLKPGGRMGIVLPDGVLNTYKLQKIRDFFLQKARLEMVVALPQCVFSESGAIVSTSIVFLKKYGSDMMYDRRNDYPVALVDLSLIDNADLQHNFEKVEKEFKNFQLNQ